MPLGHHLAKLPIDVLVGKVTSCKLWRQVGESFRPPK
ncbi:hypothetical protein LINPERPRIM_LOCUS25307 [Linum perenne]